MKTSIKDQAVGPEIVAIIPARGGSKGIPRKNLREVAGEPLIAYTIRTALKSRNVRRVVVTTDDCEIAAVARGYGADVVMRPSSISGDTATSESALLHALDHLSEAEDYHPDILVFMQCTSPLTAPEDLDGAVDLFLSSKADSVFTVSPFHGFVWKEDPSGCAVAVNHDAARRLRRQDRVPEYIENGAIYVMKAQSFLKWQHRFFGTIRMSKMPASRTLDVDTSADLDRAAAILSDLKVQGST